MRWAEIVLANVQESAGFDDRAWCVPASDPGICRAFAEAFAVQTEITRDVVGKCTLRRLRRWPLGGIDRLIVADDVALRRIFGFWTCFGTIVSRLTCGSASEEAVLKAVLTILVQAWQTYFDVMEFARDVHGLSTKSVAKSRFVKHILATASKLELERDELLYFVGSRRGSVAVSEKVESMRVTRHSAADPAKQPRLPRSELICAPLMLLRERLAPWNHALQNKRILAPLFQLSSIERSVMAWESHKFDVVSILLLEADTLGRAAFQIPGGSVAHEGIRNSLIRAFEAARANICATTNDSSKWC